MMSLSAETDQLRPSFLSKHKTNFYYEEVVIVNIEACSFLIESLPQLEHSNFTFKVA